MPNVSKLRPPLLRTQLSDLKEHDSSFSINRISQTSNTTTTTPPAIDFKLNVKIEINSGRCVLHANKTINGVGGSQSSGSGRGNNKSDQQQPQASPLNSPYYTTFNDLRGGIGNLPHAMAVEQEMRNTNFIFPAIGVKAFYESTHKRIGNPSRLAKKVHIKCIDY